MVEIHQVKIAEVDSAFSVLQDGIAYLKSLQIDQWQNGYPNRDVVLQDVTKGYGYGAFLNQACIGYAAFIFGKDPTYETIYDGNWLNENDYVTIHRLAVKRDFQSKSIAKTLFLYAKDQAKKQGVLNIRVDTHPNNLNMQGFLKHLGFVYCGKIYLLDGDLRFAYQFEIKND